MRMNGMVKITLLAAGIMTVLGGAAMAPALPSIRNQFAQLDNIDYLIRFVLTLPALFIAVFAPIAGYLVDRIGRLKILIFSLALAGLAGVSGYFVDSFNMILVGRGLVGIAVAGIMTSGTTLIADYYKGEERGRLLGLQTGLMGLGGTIMLLLVGMLADSQWNTPFLVHVAPFVVLPFVVVYLREPQPLFRCQDDHPPVGEPGACAGEAALRENLSSEPEPQSEGAPIKLLAFIYLILIVVEINFYLVPIYLPFYLGELVGASATQSGMAISFMSLSYALSSILLGKAMARQDRITIMIGAFLFLAVGYSIISLGAATIGLYFGLVIAGVSLGVLIPSLYVWLANGVPAAFRGRALGGFTTALFLGQFLSPILSQPLVNLYDVGQTMLIAGILFVILVPVLFLSRQGLRKLSALA